MPQSQANDNKDHNVLRSYALGLNKAGAYQKSLEAQRVALKASGGHQLTAQMANFSNLDRSFTSMQSMPNTFVCITYL
jgi:hypothetical protein